MVPSFEEMFADMGAALPGLTQMLLDISHWIVDYIFLFVFLFILDVVLLIKFREHSKMILKVSILSLIGGFAFVGICLYLPIFSMAKVVGSSTRLRSRIRLLHLYLCFSLIVLCLFAAR